uniref:Uncharacterized protein n=1 Tax=Trichuris muris TaxID=70415 RepID=A0A5S6Q7V5_TRIMR
MWSSDQWVTVEPVYRNALHKNFHMDYWLLLLMASYCVTVYVVGECSQFTHYFTIIFMPHEEHTMVIVEGMTAVSLRNDQNTEQQLQDE